MAASVEARWVKKGQIEWGTVATANTALDGTGTVVTVFTGAAEGSYLDVLKIVPAGTNVATVLRIFINNASTNATAINNTFWGSVKLVATTANAADALPELTVPIGRMIPAGYKVNVTLGTTVAGGYHVTGAGGEY